MDSATVIALTIFFLPLLLLFVSRVVNKRARSRLNEEIRALRDALSTSEAESERQRIEKQSLLDRYAPIINMENHTQQLLDEAEGVLAEADDTRKQSREKLKETKEISETIKSEARDEANKILDFAQLEAKRIAGDALEAKVKADSYEQAIRAMRNTIEGYKDDYIIPNHSVLDDLADEYSHKEAGEELKAVRKRVRAMVKEGYAGTCDYVETHRRSYAIHFAVDAFNGKVDSALSKVKHDNFGKIQQEIQDAYALVNHNGTPFRNARINREYLEARD